MVTMVKLHVLGFASAPTLISRSNPQRLLPVRSSQKDALWNAEVIAETNAYFESKDKSFYNYNDASKC